MILEGEDAVRFHEYLNRKPTEEEIRFDKEVLKIIEEARCPLCGEIALGNKRKFDPPI